MMAPSRSRRPSSLVALLMPAALALASCAESAGPVAEVSGQLAIEVQPLELEQIGFACYDLELLSVTSVNPTTTVETVWRRGDPWTNRADDFGNFAGDTETICSNTFGNGPDGDILYVGPCDATYPTNVVRVVVDGLYKPSGGRLPEGTDWVNPCPPSSPCEFYGECIANTDTPVVVNLTVVRSANQGFFDIGVRFDEIFCSAKVDCSYASVDADGNLVQEPIMLVHNASGEPDHTAVIGFACTAGPGEQDLTELHFNAPRIECGGGQPVGFLQQMMFCHPGEEAELFNLDWLIAGHLLANGDVDVVHSEGDLQRWVRDGLAWSGAPAGLPLQDSTSGVLFDMVVPFASFGPDRIGVYAAIFGPSPFPGSDVPGIADLKVAIISKDGSGTWASLDVLPGQSSPAFVNPRLWDPVSGDLVVRESVPDGMGYQATSWLFYTPDAGDPSGFALVSGDPVPAGIEVSGQAYIDRTYVIQVGPDNGAPAPAPISQQLRVGAASALPDGSVGYEFDSITGALPTVVDGQGDAWVLDDLHAFDEPIILAERQLLGRGIWRNLSSGATRDFPVELRISYDAVPDLWSLQAGAVSMVPGFGDVDELPSSGSMQGRGFVWTTPPSSGDVTYITYYVRSTAPYVVGGNPALPAQYVDGWQTWKLGSGGGVPQIDTVIEAGPGGEHLVLGRDASDDYFLGFLPSTSADVQWLGPLPMPNASTWLYLEGVRGVTTEGLELLFTASGGPEQEHYVQRVVLSGGDPQLGLVLHLNPGTEFDALWPDGRHNDFDDWRYRYDLRTRRVEDKCSGVYLGYANDELLPHPSDVMLVTEPMGFWDLEGPNVVEDDPPGSLGFAPQPIEPTPAFMETVDQVLFELTSTGGGGYTVLDPALPEGYAWDLSAPPPEASGAVFQYGLYYGSEELMCGDEPCNKKYFNVAIGFDAQYSNCMLAFEATAAAVGVIDGASGWATPTGDVYPVTVVRVNLTPDIEGGEGDGPGVCGQNPLNGKGSGVRTVYTMGTHDMGFPFCHHLEADGVTISTHCKPDHDYSWVDSHPIFGSSGQNFNMATMQATASAGLEVHQTEGALSVRDPTAVFTGRMRPVGIGQFPDAFPACPDGLSYRADTFACAGDCGDGVLTSDEMCDDGNRIDGDGCSGACLVELQCPDGQTYISPSALCDGRVDCPGAGGWDEGPDQCLSCGPRQGRIARSRVCDGVPDCADRRDEAGCAGP